MMTEPKEIIQFLLRQWKKTQFELNAHKVAIFQLEQQGALAYLALESALTSPLVRKSADDFFVDSDLLLARLSSTNQEQILIDLLAKYEPTGKPN
jgi:hypothetical protein